MSILKKTIRVAAIGLAVLFIGLSLFGIFGAWFVDSKTTDVVLKVFGVIETGVGVVNAGVGRVDDLIAKSRTEVRQASETIAAAGAQAQANSPVLNALNERLETSLAPRIAQMQQVLAPVRDAVGTVANAVSLVNSLPMMKDRAPRLAALDDGLNRLQELSADAIQLRGTLRALVAGQNRDITAETVATLNRLTQRIDTRLGEVQANVDGVQADIAALQARLDTRKSRLLFLFNLLALLCTLMLAWILYTQGVVIQHHWARMRRPAANGRPADTSWG
jgi:phage shock protein A